MRYICNMTARAACWMLHESYVPIECLKSSLAYDYVSRRLETTAESLQRAVTADAW